MNRNTFGMLLAESYTKKNNEQNRLRKIIANHLTKSVDAFSHILHLFPLKIFISLPCRAILCCQSLANVLLLLIIIKYMFIVMTEI